jgi:hypothetical protein
VVPEWKEEEVQKLLMFDSINFQQVQIPEIIIKRIKLSSFKIF